MKPELNNKNVACAYLGYIAFRYTKYFYNIFNDRYKSNPILYKKEKESVRSSVVQQLKSFGKISNNNYVTYVATIKPQIVSTKVNGGANNPFIKNDYFFTGTGIKMFNYFHQKLNDKKLCKNFHIKSCRKFYSDLDIKLKKYDINI